MAGMWKYHARLVQHILFPQGQEMDNITHFDNVTHEKDNIFVIH